MVDEEIYLLTKHANFTPEYVEKIPIYKRRHFLYLLQDENEKLEELREKERNKNKYF